LIDLGISKIALIGAVALIVIGPEKLPGVARTIGTLIGKAQRYVADVKAEVNRSMELDELKKMKDTVESAARDVEHSVHTASSDFEKDWAETTAGISSDGYTQAAFFADGASIPASQKEMAPQAWLNAALVQGPKRCAYQGAIERRACGAFSSRCEAFC